MCELTFPTLCFSREVGALVSLPARGVSADDLPDWTLTGGAGDAAKLNRTIVVQPRNSSLKHDIEKSTISAKSWVGVC